MKAPKPKPKSEGQLQMNRSSESTGGLAFKHKSREGS